MYFLQELTLKKYIFVIFFSETCHLQHRLVICGHVWILIVMFCLLFIPPLPTSSGTNSDRRFRTKYHPDETSRLKAETQSALNNRLNVFTFLMENGWFDNVSLDIDQTPAIIKVLDAGELE